MACKINLFECIVNEGTRFLQEVNERTNDQVDKSDLDDVKSFLDELKATQPVLFENPINPNIIEDLHKVSDDIKQTYMRKKERRESVKEKRRNSSSRKLSLEERQEPPRRHSEGGTNARFKNTGSVSEWTNHRNPTGPKHQTRHSAGSFSSIPDTQKVSLEKNCEGQKRTSYRSNNPTNTSSNSGVRRRNSGGNSDMMRGGHFVSFKRQMSEGVPQKIPEIPLQMTGGTSSKSQQEPTRKSDSQYPRKVSWSSKIVTETPKYENWRKEGNKVKNLNPD